MAIIYYIRNRKSGRMYIGQTVQTLEQRIKQHLIGEIEIDRDIRKLGIESFDYDVIEECADTELDAREIYYIAKYDTYLNGYNNQLGGRKRGNNKYESIIEHIRYDYANGMSMIDLNIKYKVRSEYIRNIVKDINRADAVVVHTNISKAIIAYTKDWKRIKTFESIKDALKWLNEQRAKDGKSEVDSRNFYRTVKTACIKHGIASGYRWQYVDDLMQDGLQFNCYSDINNYKLGLPYKCVDGITFCDNHTNTNTNIKANNKRNKDIVEIIRELAKTHSSSDIANLVGYNVASVNRIIKKYNIKVTQREDATYIKYKLDEDIFQKVQLGYSYNTIASEYGLTYDSVRMRYNRYLKKNGVVKEDTRIVNGVTCVELNKSFDSLLDAARYLRGDYTLSGSELKGCSYSISLAARNGTKYKGYHWRANK